jgi:phosphonoacetaldehyde hydrolase
VKTRKLYTGPLQAIILDWAGTTMDYGCYAPAVVFVDVYKRRGVPISMEEARIPMGAHKRVHIASIAKIPSVRDRWMKKFGRECTEKDIDEMFADFVPLQMACLADYADMIPGALDSVAAFRKRGLKIGSTTGYTVEMTELLLREAKKRGYEPDVSVCAGEVPYGRPEPWMCLENAKRLRVFPLESIVKVGDTLPDIEEGLNAHMWTIGLAKTGNEMGLNEREVKALPKAEYDRRLLHAHRRLREVGAHYVVDAITDVLPILDQIDARLARGERP